MRGKRNLPIIFLALVLSVTWLSISMAAEPVLQTQYGPDGIEVDLVRAKVSGKVMSVVLVFRYEGENSVQMNYRVKDVYYIDNSESKKYHVLKDAKGEWLSAPVSKAVGKKIMINHVFVSPGKNKIVWYKFPAPPENVTHIQLLLPKISPFDDVEIVR